MRQARIDFYTKVHKGLRAGLFALSQRAATADYADAADGAALAAEARALLARLARHAEHEAHFVHPLLAAKLGHTAFDAEHAVLEAERQALETMVNELSQAPAEERYVSGLRFYRALNAFIACYLQHLGEEEAIMPQLWQCCSDAELAEVMARFAASRGLEEALSDLGWMLPALSTRERAELVGGMSAAMRR